MKALITPILCFLISATLLAQDKSMDPLKAPAMPASSIIGAQANEVARPKSLKGLETALINNGLSTNGMVFPNSFALEVTPYMLSPRKNFNYLDYLKSNKETSIKQTMMRNFSVSLSSTQNFSVNDTQMVNAMGFGMRTIILNGKPNPEIARAFKLSLETNQNYIDANNTVRSRIKLYVREHRGQAVKKDTIIHYLQQKKASMDIPDEIFIQAIKTIENLPNNLNGDVFVSEFNNAFVAQYTAPNFELLKSLLDDVKMNRYGLRWDIQAALGTAYPTHAFSYSVVPRWGVWTNISYKALVDKNKVDANGNSLSHISNFEFIGMFRWLQNNNDFYRQFAPDDSTFKAGNFFDFGGRIVFEHKKFSAEAEAVYRINTTVSTIDLIQKNSLKYVFNFNYNITDNVVLSYFIGKDFDQSNLTQGDLISGLSLNLGFGDFKLSDLANSF